MPGGGVMKRLELVNWGGAVLRGGGGVMGIWCVSVPGWNNQRSNTMTPIDHKDEAGEYRDSVRAEVLSHFPGEAVVVSHKADMFGTWRWRTPHPEKGEVTSDYELLPSGQLRITISLDPNF